VSARVRVRGRLFREPKRRSDGTVILTLLDDDEGDRRYWTCICAFEVAVPAADLIEKSIVTVRGSLSTRIYESKGQHRVGLTVAVHAIEEPALLPEQIGPNDDLLEERRL